MRRSSSIIAATIPGTLYFSRIGRIRSETSRGEGRDVDAAVVGDGIWTLFDDAIEASAAVMVIVITTMAHLGVERGCVEEMSRVDFRKRGLWGGFIVLWITDCPPARSRKRQTAHREGLIAAR